MRYVVLLLSLCAVQYADAANLASLADCASSVFNEINRTKQWSGKAPAGCPAKVSVEKRSDGALVTTWVTDRTAGGWKRTAYVVLMGYSEIADGTALAKGNRDVKERAGRMGRCLDSLITVNDPLYCRYKATKEYYAEEKMGTERRWLIWLDDNGRQSAVEYVIGDTAYSPAPPADIFSGEQLPPGTDFHILLER